MAFELGRALLQQGDIDGAIFFLELEMPKKKASARARLLTYSS